MSEKKYRNFRELSELTEKRRREFTAVDPAYLNEEGKLLREVWGELCDTFRTSFSLDDAVTDICLKIDNAIDAAQSPFANRSYYYAFARKLSAFVKAQMPREVWAGYPLIADPTAA